VIAMIDGCIKGLLQDAISDEASAIHKFEKYMYQKHMKLDDLRTSRKTKKSRQQKPRFFSLARHKKMTTLKLGRKQSLGLDATARKVDTLKPEIG